MAVAAPTSEFTALWRGVTAAPLDAAPKLVLADWLAERGRDAALEAGLRYCAEHGRWPLQDSWTGKKIWTWYFAESDTADYIRRNESLPQAVWNAIAARAGAYDFAGFGGCDAKRLDTAVRRLGRAVLALGGV